MLKACKTSEMLDMKNRKIGNATGNNTVSKYGP